MASNLKLSVVLEAVTSAFNSAVRAAADAFAGAEGDMEAAARSASEVVDESSTKQATSLDQLVTATKQATTEIQRQSSAMAATKQAIDTSSEAYKKQQAAINELDAELTAYLSANDRAYSAAVKFEQGTDLLDRGLRAGLITQQQYNQQLSALSAKYGTTAQAAIKAAQDTEAANESVKPPATFEEFFKELVDGWKLGANSATQAAAQTRTASDSAAASIRALGQQLGVISPTARQVGADIANSLSVKNVSTDQITRLKQAINDLDPTAKKVGTDVEVALALRNLSPKQIEKIKQALGDLGPEAKKDGEEVEKGLTLSGLVRSVAAIVTVRQALKELTDNAVELQQITNQLNFATGGATQGAAAFAFLRDTANSLGLSLEASAKGFAQLTTATKGTQLEGQATRDLFLGVSQAAATMGLSVSDTEGVFNALTQIASKGTVQMEELRGQLGDRLPGVLKIAADAMGVTVQQLNGMVTQGIDANQFLKAFGPALQNAFSGQASENVKTLGGQIAILKNQFFDLLSSINQSGTGLGLTTIVHDISDGLAQIAQLFRQASASPEFEQFRGSLASGYGEIKEAIGGVIDVATQLYTSFNQVYGQIQEIVNIFATGDALDGHQLSLLQTALGGIALAVAAVNDGFKGLQVLISVVTGTVDVVLGGLTSAAGKIAALFSRDLSHSLSQFSDQLFAAADKSFARADQQATSFKSSIGSTLDALGAAAAAAQAKADPTKQLQAAQSALTELINSSKSGVTATADIQTQADAVSAAFKKLYDQGVITNTQLKNSLDQVAKTIPGLKPPIDDFLSRLTQVGVNGLENFSKVGVGIAQVSLALKGDLTPAVAESLLKFAQLATQAGLSSNTIRVAFTNLVDGAKTAADIDAVQQALGAMIARGQLAGKDIPEAFREIQDAALKLPPAIGQSYIDTLARVGATTKQQQAQVIEQARIDLQRVKELYAQGAVGIDAVVDAQVNYAKKSASALQQALDAVGGSTKDQLTAAAAAAKAHLDELTEAYGRGQVGLDVLTRAQVAYQNAVAATTPGVTTLKDVENDLAEQEKNEAERKQAAAAAQQAYNQKAKEGKPVVSDLTSAGVGLATMFVNLRDSLLSMSAAAANDFGQRLGIQFGYVDAGATDATAAVSALRQEISTLSQFSGTDFIGISSKMKEITQAADAVKISFIEQKAAADDSAQRIQALAESGTVSLAQLQAATKLSGQSFGILGKADLTGLNSALDAAKARITAIEDASKSAADALKSMGDSFQVELLRSQGKNVEAIQLEAQQQAAEIDKQIAALGKNASPDAIAQANRTKGLLDQITAQKIAAQKASDAADAANAKKTSSTDATPDISVTPKTSVTTPPQASAPQPSTATPPTSATPSASTITIKFQDASGKSTSLTADTPTAANDLLAILTRAGATNITKIGG